MTESKTRAAVAAAGELRSLPMSHKELLLCAAAYFDKRPDQGFVMPLEIEYMAEQDLRAMSTRGTMFEHVETALNLAGVATDGTMGSVMTPLEFGQDDMHAFCGCHAPEHDGAFLGAVFRSFAEGC